MDEKTAKGSGSQMSAPAIRSGIDRKLHRLTRPAHSGVSAPAKRPRDVKAEAGGQRPADAEAGGQRPADAKAGGLRSGGQRGQESELRGPRSAGLGPELEDK